MESTSSSSNSSASYVYHHQQQEQQQQQNANEWNPVQGIYPQDEDPDFGLATSPLFIRPEPPWPDKYTTQQVDNVVTALSALYEDLLVALKAGPATI